MKKKEDDETLTPREIEVLQWAAKGKGQKQTADLLKISEDTVEVHRGHIFKKLKVAGIGEAIAHGLRKGIIK